MMGYGSIGVLKVSEAEDFPLLHYSTTPLLQYSGAPEGQFKAGSFSTRFININTNPIDEDVKSNGKQLHHTKFRAGA